MSKTRIWAVGTAVLGVLLLVASWFLLIGPQRSDAAELRDQTRQQEAFNDSVKLKTAQLKAQFAQLPARQAQLAEIKQQMPENPALPSLVRDLSRYADQSGVLLQSVAPTTPVPLTAPGTPAGTASATQGIQQVQTTVVATGSYAELTLYLQKLQAQMRRAVLVSNIQLAPASVEGAAKDDLQMTVVGRVFVLDTSAVAVAAPATTTSTATAN